MSLLVHFFWNTVYILNETQAYKICKYEKKYCNILERVTHFTIRFKMLFTDGDLI